jgi:hypothetical protein
MNTKTLIPLLILFMASPAAADQASLRYSLAGTLKLHMEQDMYPGGQREAIADRRFDITFEFTEGEVAEISAVKATYTAHGMKQRLSTRHLVGQPTALTTDGRSVSLEDPGDSSADIDLGPITDGGLHPSSLLVDVLPVLPDEAVTKGLSWETTRPVRSLEGWAWAEGTMLYSNEVTDIKQSKGRTVVHVRSQGKTSIAAAGGTTGFVGEGTLERQFRWTFDADSGRLLSLSLKQEGTGINQLPQGQVQVRQITRIKLQGS